MSQPTTADLSTMDTGVHAIADLARAGAKPERLDLGGFYVVQGGDGKPVQIDLTGERYVSKPNPDRVNASVAVNDTDSLLSYWDKHSDEDSDVYADRQRHTISAVLDANRGADTHDGADRPRWQSHRAVLTLSVSEALAAWIANNGKILTQDQFAEFVEDWMPLIVSPPAADLVEMAQSFQATTSAQFKAGFKLQSGARVVSYTESVDASVKGGEVAVPTDLALRLPVWRGSSDVIDMTARIRFRVNHGGPGKLGLGYKLDRPTEAIDAAFEAEVARVQEHIGRHVLRGSPA